MFAAEARTLAAELLAAADRADPAGADPEAIIDLAGLQNALSQRLGIALDQLDAAIAAARQAPQG